MELIGLDRVELTSYCMKLGHSPFRGRQIAEWIYKAGVRDIRAMANIPASLRDELVGSTTLTRSEVIKESRSKDGATKFLLKLGDGEAIETVLLPYPDRTSVCVLTQVGCSAGCKFCAATERGFVRNLSAGEIVDQVITLQQRSGSRVTHVVFMGMGEPMLNFDNVIKAIYLLNAEVGIAMRHLTISTVGLPAVIQRLKEMDLQLTLALSLHAPDDNLRRQIIPLASRYPLDELISACRDYANFTKRRVTFEYLLLAGVNDSIKQALQLARLLKHTLCNVNLIPYNEVAGKQFSRPTRATIAAFRSVLEREGVEVTQRMERGHAVSAACGQLRNKAWPRMADDGPL